MTMVIQYAEVGDDEGNDAKDNNFLLLGLCLCIGDVAVVMGLL